MRFIDEALRPSDLLLVMKPLDHLTEIRFTRDRTAARAAVSSFTGRRNEYTPRSAFEDQYLGRSPSAVRSARAQIVISGLRALATRIGDLNGGLGGIVLLSEGFTTEVPRARERRLPDLQGLVRASGRFRVFVYAFDPGVIAPPGDAGADPSTTVADAAIESSVFLQSLARQTGGDGLAAGQDLGPALQRVSRDLDWYYVLTFTAPHANDGRFHAVRVTTSRRDATVRARSGYWAPLQSGLRAAAARVNVPAMLPTRALRRSPFIDSWFGLTVEPNGGRRIIFTWTPSSARTPARGKPPVRPDVVALKVTTPAGTVLFDGEVASARAGNVSTIRPTARCFRQRPAACSST